MFIKNCWLSDSSFPHDRTSAWHVPVVPRFLLVTAFSPSQEQVFWLPLSFSQRPRSPSLLLLLISVDCCCQSHHISSPLSFPALSSHSISAVFSFLSSVLFQGLPALVWRHWAYKHVAGQLNSTFLSYNWSSQLPQSIRFYLWLLWSQMDLVILSSKKRTYVFLFFFPGYLLLWSHSRSTGNLEINYQIRTI